jgi:DNA invertase Pin-like site-specific DNA recombinase
MSTLKKKQLQEEKARQRAEIIMKVRSGIMTVTEGAVALGVSRKTSYKWENRALSAMLDGLEDRVIQAGLSSRKLRRMKLN